MKKLVTIGGSSSRNSINKQLAEYVGSLVANVDIFNVDLNDYKIPMFSIDEETDNGFSDDLLSLNEVIESADIFIISLAEHNGAYSAVFKNMFDWLSRINGNVWREKPMLLMATSTGARGGSSVLEIAKRRFPYNGGNIVGSLSVPSFEENFKDGKVINSNIKIEIDKLLEELLKHS